mgnify:CR=1 FL=1
MNVILASNSPRRAALLRQMGVSFIVAPSNLEESQPLQPYRKWVQELAKLKAAAVKEESPDGVILAADTMVLLKDLVLGKPRDDQEAKEMLLSLSGRVHQVMTGICVLNSQTEEIFQDVEMTQVYFRILTEREIESYVASGEPQDKAGAYGIQGLGGLFVERIVGCYYNVMGLPLVKTMRLLRKSGVTVLGETRG